MDWKKAGVIAGITDAVLVNVFLGIVTWRSFDVSLPADGGLSSAVYSDNNDKCGVECQSEISSRINGLKLELKAEDAAVLAEAKATTPTPLPKENSAVSAPVSKKKVRTVQYVTIPGSGTTRSLSWDDFDGTDFYFDKADYSGLVEVYFEANMSLLNGNGKAFVRLLDATHGIGVDGGEVQTSSQTAGIITSGKLNFWTGKNLIRIQAKSLTSDTTVYNYGRLKVITEN
jgi:hypothetical protein